MTGRLRSGGISDVDLLKHLDICLVIATTAVVTNCKFRRKRVILMELSRCLGPHLNMARYGLIVYAEKHCPVTAESREHGPVRSLKDLSANIFIGVYVL